MALPDSDRRHLLGIDDLDQASIESLVLIAPVSWLAAQARRA